ncbi:MAG: peptide deformylase [Candidatus Riflebacteria bacterium]|nr:peptide deformylase [Candidatus Riflebacteria bacterium]
MAIKEILKLGNPELFKACKKVEKLDSNETLQTIQDLKDTLQNFQKINGFGRAIAAPQIGIIERIIFVDFPTENLFGPLINPKIVWQSQEKIQLWDDCFSFPELLVKVERAKEIKVEYSTPFGEVASISAKNDFSELLQHEIDHLDGILSVQRAIGGTAFALRSEWKKLGKNGSS